ncbi:hypothetical protein B0T20DRAFT_345869 [Sordaria brevicollis]|uniref:Uncharacterized protein n=1 Tax=Sordaria brevicollis TaxID=83679 RepID=A0AAE0UFD9_SORBR|nr:hypothetical protein B0T20DRAFT_345869 [Sordaria brevicollis]
MDSTSSDSPIETPLLPHERLDAQLAEVEPVAAGLSPPHYTRHRRSAPWPTRSSSSSDSDSYTHPFFGIIHKKKTPSDDGSNSSSSGNSSKDSDETIKAAPLLPHEQLGDDDFGSGSTQPSRAVLRARRRFNARLNRDKTRQNPFLLERVQRASLVEPEVQYQQGRWFPSTGTNDTTTVPVPIVDDNSQRHWGDFCTSPELMTPVLDNQQEQEVRRSLQPLFDMDVFGSSDDESASEVGQTVCANNETEANIVANLEEGYFPPAPASEVQAKDEEEGKLKKSESMVSFKDLNIPPPKAPTPAPILALKRQVSFACETATEAVKGSQSRVAAKASSLVGSLFDYLIEYGF